MMPEQSWSHDGVCVKNKSRGEVCRGGQSEQGHVPSGNWTHTTSKRNDWREEECAVSQEQREQTNPLWFLNAGLGCKVEVSPGRRTAV